MVAPAVYAPERGHFVWTDFNPRIGREQSGRRPALVLSAVGYNRASGLAVVCPLTSQVKGYTFEVQIPTGLAVHGAILIDAVKNIHWRTRGISFICDCPFDTFDDVLVRFASLIGIPWP